MVTIKKTKAIKKKKDIKKSNLKKQTKEAGVKKLIQDLLKQLDKAAGTQLKKLKKDIHQYYYEEIKKQIGLPAFVGAVIKVTVQIVHSMQKEYWGGSGKLVLQEDLTQLGHPEHIEAIKEEVVRNLAMAEVDPKSETVIVEAISEDFMGTGSDNDEMSTKKRIPWLHYFIMGHFEGNLIWVNPEVYEIIKGDEGEGLGRFGNGYMWHLWPGENKRISAQLKGSGIKLSDLKHGQSGKAGKDWFADIFNMVDIVGLVMQPALDKAMERVAREQAQKKVKK